MKKGQGWARRVTLDNLPEFASWLRQADDAQTEAARKERKQKKVAARSKPSPFRGVPLALPSRFRPTRATKKAETSRKRGSLGGKRAATRGRSKRRGALIWRKTLWRADAQAPKAGSHPKGYMTFAQAREVNVIKVDATTYFRNELFGRFPWKKVPSNQPTWEALIPFDFTIRRRHFGVHQMRLTHKPSRIADQGNPPTVLHWKNLPTEVRQLIRPNDRLALYDPPSGKTDPFFIEIS